jgi:hypothetical protein
VLQDLEMGRAGHAVEQMQVVREHAGGKQRLAQLRQDPRVVDLVCVIGVDDDDLIGS